MFIERKKERIYPKDFQDYTVFLKKEGWEIQGNLGNISESGMCVLIRGEEDLPIEQKKLLSGEISSRMLDAPIEFKAHVAWTGSTSIQGKPYHLIGMSFSGELMLPTPLLVLGMSTKD